MTRIRGVTLRNREKRIPLQDLVPLDHPLVFYPEPTNLCNFRCKMCPTGNADLIKQVGRPAGMMPLSLWKKMVEDLKEFGKPVECAHLFKDGESLLHPDFPEMLTYIKEAGVAKKLWIKTNGSRLEPGLNRVLSRCLDNIGISIEHVTPAGYWERSGVQRFNYERMREHILDLYTHRGACRLYIKIPSQGLTEQEIDKFYRDFEDRCDYIGLENYHGWSSPELGDFTMGYSGMDTYDGDPLTDKIACPWTLFSLTVNWNGAVSVCPEDWAHRTILGNIKAHSLKEIWEGEPMFRFRRMHLEGRRDQNIACRGCYFTRTLPDNVDAYRGEILEKLIRRKNEHRL